MNSDRLPEEAAVGLFNLFHGNLLAISPHACLLYTYIWHEPALIMSWAASTSQGYGSAPSQRHLPNLKHSFKCCITVHGAHMVKEASGWFCMCRHSSSRQPWTLCESVPAPPAASSVLLQWSTRPQSGQRDCNQRSVHLILSAVPSPRTSGVLTFPPQAQGNVLG